MTIKPNRLDTRQVEYRGSLDQLTNLSVLQPTELDNLLSSINAETTPLLRMVPSSPASRVFAVEGPSVYNPETGRKRSIPPINGLIPNFTAALIRLPLYASDSQTPQYIEVAYASGEWSSLKPLYLNPNKYIKIGLNLDPLGEIVLTFGSEGSSPEGAGAAPSVANTYTIGYVVAHNTGGIIDNLDTQNIFQFIGAHGGDGTGTANVFVETLKNQLVDSPYDLLTDNIIYIDGTSKISNLSGAEYDIVTTTIKYTQPSQSSTSINLADPNEFLGTGLDIDSADVTVFWNAGSLVQGYQIPNSKTFTSVSASTSSGSPTVTVAVLNHGLNAGDFVSVKTSSALGGVSALNLSIESVSLVSVTTNTLSYLAKVPATQTAVGYLDYLVTGFAYLASRDGNNFFPVDMKRLGSSEVYYGNITFGQRTTAETYSSAIYTISNPTQPASRRSLSVGGKNKISQSFFVPSGSSQILDSVVFQGLTNGLPAGYLYASIVKDQNGLPSELVSDSVTTSLPLTSTSANGAVTFKFNRTVLSAGSYHIVISGNLEYQLGSGYVSFLEQTSGGESNYTENSLWSVASGSKNLDMQIYGRSLDLRLKIISLSQGSFPFGLDGYGVFYSQQSGGLVTGTKKIQKFLFSGADNRSSFPITLFSPDADLLTCYHVESGKAYRYPAFQLQGNTAVFPSSFFAAASSQSVTLIFDQNSGGSIDNSNDNAQLLANNHLGSQMQSLDRSAPGRGLLLRRYDNQLREFTINNDNNLSILDENGFQVAILGTSATSFATPLVAGIVSTADQTFGGKKKFNDASSFYSAAGSILSGSYDDLGKWTFNNDVNILGNVNNSSTGYIKIPSGSDSQRPSTAVEGMVRYNTTRGCFECYAAGSWQDMARGQTITKVVQNNSSTGTNFGPFAVGTVLYLNNGVYTKALATTSAASTVAGVVSRVIDTNLSTYTFDFTVSGRVDGLTGLVPGSTYFLSSSTAGSLSTSEPTAVGNYSVPVGVAVSTTSMYVSIKQTTMVGSSYLISQPNLTITNVADASLGGNFLSTGSGNRTISVWNFKEGQSITILAAGAANSVITIAAYSDSGVTPLTVKYGSGQNGTMASTYSLFTSFRTGGSLNWVVVGPIHGLS